MKRHFIYIILAALVGFSACSENEDSDANEEPIDENAVRCAEVASILYDADINEPHATSPKPLSGLVLDAATPNHYSVGLQSADEALQWFVNHCVPFNEQEAVLTLPKNQYRIDFGSYGSITYQADESASCYARVSVSLPNLCVQQQFELIPIALMPDNDNSIFYRGNMVRDNTDSQYYLCVRACEGDVGILISFSKKWEAKEYALSTYKDWWKGEFELYRGLSEDAWRAYAQMYWRNEANFVALLNDMKSKVPSMEFMEAPAVYSLTDSYNYNSYRYAAGAERGSRHLWWGRKVWSLWQNFVYIGKREIGQHEGGTMLPSFRTEKNVHVAFHKSHNIPEAYKGSHEERFINTDAFRKRFTLVYNGNI